MVILCYSERKRKDFVKLKGIIQTGRTSRFEMFQSQPAPQPTGEIRVNRAVTHTHRAEGRGMGGGFQTESSALVDGSPPFSLRFQFSPASTTLAAHALCAGWTGRLGGSWVHPALFHQVLCLKKEQPYVLVWLLHLGSIRCSLKDLGLFF